jgi:EF hand domain-containing protein
MKKTLLLIAAATLIPMGAAVAGEGKDKAGSMGPSFDTLDANRDGRISQAEAATDTTIVFTTADKNGDGYLDKTEWRAHMKSGSSTQPQPQSLPESSSPEATSPDSSATDSTVPEPSASEPKPDTETPRQ